MKHGKGKDSINNKSHKSKLNNLALNILVLFIGCILALSVLEIFLRFHNPFISRVKGNKIVLSANEEYLIKTKGVEGLDETVIYRTNSIGFRGDDPPEDFDNYLTIISVGSSTTECSLNSEGKTWTDILGGKLNRVFPKSWINNAGFDGHSTFGHKVLLQDHLVNIKPKIILFLVGGMDAGLESLGEADKAMLKEGFYFSSIKEVLMSLANKSEVFSLGLNVFRYFRASVIGVTPEKYNLVEKPMLHVSEEDKAQLINKHTDKYIDGYKDRLTELIHIAKDNNIEPILITFPFLFGDAIDDVTNVDLGMMKVRDGVNGSLAWQVIELYNNITRQVGEAEKLFVVELADEMPKSSRYYFDTTHFTNEGAGKVADILYKYLCPYLKGRYDGYSLAEADCSI